MNMNGWEQLICKYFCSTCIDEFSDSLKIEGFTVGKIELHGAVIFRRFDVFIEIGYELESAPNYSPRVIVGLGSSRYYEDGSSAGVPLWFVIPEDEHSVPFSLWTFSSEPQLREVLGRIRVEVLERFGRPLWERTEVLEETIARFHDRLV